MLERRGIISGYEGSKPRRVLVENTEQIVGLGPRKPESFEPPDDESPCSPGLFDQLKSGHVCRSASRLASSSIRASGAPMQTWIPPPKPMCCAGVLTCDVELVRSLEHARVAVRGAEEQCDLRSARDRHVADREVVRQHPALEQL